MAFAIAITTSEIISIMIFRHIHGTQRTGGGHLANDLENDKNYFAHTHKRNKMTLKFAHKSPSSFGRLAFGGEFMQGKS